MNKPTDLRDNIPSIEDEHHLVRVLQRNPPTDVSGAAPNDMHSGIDCLIHVLRNILSHYRDRTTFGSLEADNPALVLAWRAFTHDPNDRRLLQLHCAERYRALQAFVPGSDEPDPDNSIRSACQFLNLVENQLMLDTIWSMDDFLLFEPSPPQQSDDTKTKRAYAAAKSALFFRSDKHPSLTMAEVLETQTMEIVANEPLVLRKPLFIRLAYLPRANDPMPFTEIRKFRLFPDSERFGTEGINYELIAVVRSGYAGRRRELVRTYHLSGCAIQPDASPAAAWSFINDDWSIADASRPVYKLFYRLSCDPDHHGGLPEKATRELDVVDARMHQSRTSRTKGLAHPKFRHQSQSEASLHKHLESREAMIHPPASAALKTDPDTPSTVSSVWSIRGQNPNHQVVREESQSGGQPLGYWNQTAYQSSRPENPSHGWMRAHQPAPMPSHPGFYTDATQSYLVPPASDLQPVQASHPEYHPSQPPQGQHAFAPQAQFGGSQWLGANPYLEHQSYPMIRGYDDEATSQRPPLPLPPPHHHQHHGPPLRHYPHPPPERAQTGYPGQLAMRHSNQLYGPSQMDYGVPTTWHRVPHQVIQLGLPQHGPTNHYPQQQGMAVHHGEIQYDGLMSYGQPPAPAAQSQETELDEPGSTTRMTFPWA